MKPTKRVLSAIGVCLVLQGLTTEVGMAQGWTALNNGLTNLDVWVVAMDPFDSSRLYAGGPGGIFRSSDGGTNWSLTSLVMTPESISGLPGRTTPLVVSSVVAHLAIDSENPNILYAGTVRMNGCAYVQRRVFKSTDGGATWTNGISPNINGCDDIQSLVLAPGVPNTLYLANYDNFGDTWSPIVKSTDGASSWTYLGGFFTDVLAIDPVDPLIVYAGTFDASGLNRSGVFKSTDGGAGWKATGLTNAGISVVTVDPKNPQSIYAAAFNSSYEPRGFRGLQKSVDGGASWTSINNGLGQLIGTAMRATSLLVDPNDSAVAYLGTFGAGVFKSIDGGATWIPLNGGLPDLSARSLAIAANQTTLYAGTKAGVFKLTQSRPILSLEAPQLCTGAHWMMIVRNAASNSKAKAIGVSDGKPWEVADWQTTDSMGGFSLSGTFASGSEGSHSLRVEIAGDRSNSVSYIVKRCDGEMDAAFGIAGKVIRSSDIMKIQPDGKILTAAGGTVSRSNADGSPDMTFGAGGTVTTRFPRLETGDPTFELGTLGLAIQSDGKIVVSGMGSDVSGVSGGFLARYNTDGSLDSAFGDGGVVYSDNFEYGAIAITSNGKVLVVSGLAIARYNTDGSLDTTFGTGGRTIRQFDNYGGQMTNLAIQSDGLIVVGGAVFRPSTFIDWDFALARYNSDGSPDTTFGQGGAVITDLSTQDHGCAMTLQSDGKIILAGSVFMGYADNTWNDFALLRYNRDGSLDSTFGLAGRVTTDFAISVFERQNDSACAVAMQPDGRIVAGGTSYTGYANERALYRYNGALARYNHDGSLDLTFGVRGKISTAYGISSLGIEADGRIVTAGAELTRYLNSLMPITALTFDPPIVRPGASFTTAFWGADATDQAYFDIRFRSPGNVSEVVIDNWQKGARAEFAAARELGSWLITGVRAHRDMDNHSGEFTPIRANLTVSENPRDEVRLSLNSTQFCVGSSWQLRVAGNEANAWADLSGAVDGVAWEAENWRRTAVDGSLVESGTFAKGSEGIHLLRVKIGDWISNTIVFTVSRCTL